MKLLKLVKAILSVLFMVLTLVSFFKDDSHNMCFFGILCTWYLIDIAHGDIMDKLK